MSGPIRLLLVEDDDDVLLTREHLDETFGGDYAFDHAATVPDALDIADRHDHDVYLVDFRLGSENGIDFVHRVKRKNGTETPIILLTDQDDRETDLRAMAAGATDFLVKRNIDAQTLERSICYSIKQKESESRIKQLARESERANQARSEFQAHMSHELRTPLNSILGFSQMLIEGVFGAVGNDKHREYLNDIHDSGHHLLNLINDVLDLSKIEAGELSLEEEEVDLDELLHFCVRMIRGRKEAETLTISYIACRDLPPVRADKRLIKQTVFNLLSNAVKYNVADGTVRMSAALAPDNAVSVDVADSGVGIAFENIPKVLEPFGQARDDALKSHEGTGLGLSLSKQLIELHGGTLELLSEPGKGTTVSVRFPAECTVAV